MCQFCVGRVNYPATEGFFGSGGLQMQTTVGSFGDGNVIVEFELLFDLVGSCGNRTLYVIPLIWGSMDGICRLEL